MYQSYRRVDIRSKSLSTLYYATLAVAITAVFLLAFVSHGHLNFAEPQATRFLRTAEPERFASKATCPAGVMERFSQEGRSVGCTIWDWLQIVEASREELFLTTFVEEVMEKRVCSRHAQSCGEQPLWSEVNRTVYFTASPEMMKVHVDHELVSTGGKSIAVADDDEIAPAADTVAMKGLLLPHDICHQYATGGNYDESRALELLENGEDEFSVDDLLKAAGSPQLAESDVDDELVDVLRRRGVHLEVTVYYSNLWKVSGSLWSYFFPSNPPRYIYCVDGMKKKTAAGSKLSDPPKRRFLRKDAKFIATVGEETSYLSRSQTQGVSAQDETRVIRTHYGVHLHFRTAGKLASLSFSAALIFIAGSLSLLSLPWTLTELYLSLIPLLTKSLPAWYYGALIKTTDDVKKQADHEKRD